MKALSSLSWQPCKASHSELNNPHYQDVRGQLKVHLDNPQGFALLVEVGADLGGARVLGKAALANYIHQKNRELEDKLLDEVS